MYTIRNVKVVGLVLGRYYWGRSVLARWRAPMYQSVRFHFFVANVWSRL